MDNINILDFHKKLMKTFNKIINSNNISFSCFEEVLNTITDIFKTNFSLFILFENNQYFSNSNSIYKSFYQLYPEKTLNKFSSYLKEKFSNNKDLLILSQYEIKTIFSDTNSFYNPEQILALPLISDRLSAAIIFIDKQDKTTFSEEFMETLNNLQPILKSFISNSIYIIRNNDKLNSYKQILDVNKNINSNINIHDLLNDIMNSAKDILKAQASSLLLIDKKTKELYFDIISNKENNILTQIRLPIGVGIAGIVAKTGKPILVKDAKNDPRVFKKVDEITTIQTKNLLCVPMIVNNEIIGVLEVINSLEKPHFDEEDLILFQAIAEQAGIAINNRNLIDNLKKTNKELAKKVKELSAISQISHYMSKNFEYDINKIFSKAIQIIFSVLDISRISIFLYNEKNKKLQIVDAIGIKKEYFPELNIPLSNKIMGYVFKKGKSLLVTDITKQREFGIYKRLRYKTKSFISIPIKVKDKIIGIINFSDKKDETAFTNEDLQTLETISLQLSEAYENASFYHEILEKQRIEKELEIAYRIQKSILPTTFPLKEYVDIAALSIPALEVGGDFYNFIQVDDKKLVVYIADVSGKGIPASLFMALSRSIMNIQSRSLKQPASVLEQSNKFILADSRDGTFVTLFYLLIDVGNNQFYYGNAGHNPQIYYNSEEDKLYELNAKGVPLGILPDPFFDEKKQVTNKNDFIVLFTDGVLEAINNNNEEYGIERLKKVIMEHKNDSADDIMVSIKKDISKFCQSTKQFDDLTLTVIKFI